MFEVVITYEPHGSNIQFDATYRFENISRALSFIELVNVHVSTPIESYTIYDNSNFDEKDVK